MTTLENNVDPVHSEKQNNVRREDGANRKCPAISGQYGLWQSEKLKNFHEDRVWNYSMLRASLCRRPQHSVSPHRSYFRRKPSAD